MKRTLNFLVGVAVVASMGACTSGEAAFGAGGQAPMFEVDPLWPQPLPNHWLVGPMIGVAVDARDHIWVVHRNTLNQFVLNTEIGIISEVSECCQPRVDHDNFCGNLQRRRSNMRSKPRGFCSRPWRPDCHGYE